MDSNLSNSCFELGKHRLQKWPLWFYGGDDDFDCDADGSWDDCGW